MDRKEHEAWLARLAEEDRRRRAEAEPELARKEAALREAEARLAAIETSLQEIEGALEEARREAGEAPPRD